MLSAQKVSGRRHAPKHRKQPQQPPPPTEEVQSWYDYAASFFVAAPEPEEEELVVIEPEKETESKVKPRDQRRPAHERVPKLVQRTRPRPIQQPRK